MFDITTGTGDFIANGVISHNCFARRTHEWLELDSGHDFDSQIVVKTNLVDVLRRELARPSWKREHVALGTNTDPYQRAEGRYQLMPGVIRALADSGTPFSILTKGTLLRRDIPLLAEAAQRVPVGLGVSMAIWDDDLHAALEPGVPTPRARLDLVRAITDAGLPCGVFLAPVLPGLTDGVADLDAALGAIAAAGATGVTVIPLHLRPGAREWFMAWLRARPSRAGAALRAAVRPARLRARPSTAPGSPSGSRRCWRGTASTGSRAARRGRSTPDRHRRPGRRGGRLPGGQPAVRRSARAAPRAGAAPRSGAARRPGSSSPCSERGRPQTGEPRSSETRAATPTVRSQEVPIMASPARTTGTFTREQLVQALDRLQADGRWSPYHAAALLAGARPVARRRPRHRRRQPRPGALGRTGWPRRRATPAPSSSARRAPCSSASTGRPSAARAGSPCSPAITLVLAAVGIAVALAGPARAGGRPAAAGARGAPAGWPAPR